MNNQYFIALVAKMRDVQKRFRAKPSYLDEQLRKRLEIEVDKILREWQQKQGKSNEPTLFT